MPRLQTGHGMLMAIAATFLLLAGNCGRCSQAETLKDFLASSPSVDEFIFKKRQLYQLVYPDAPRVDTNHWQCFHAKRQGTDFLLGEIASPEEAYDVRRLTNGSLKVFGKCGPLFWKMIGDNYVFWEDQKNAYSTDYTPFEKLPNAQLLQEVSAMRGLLLQALHLGIADLQPGTLKWNSNSFKAQTHDGRVLEGELVLESNLPKNLHYWVAGEKGKSVVTLTYPSSTLKDVSLPGKLLYAYEKPSGETVPVAEFEVVSLRSTAPDRIPADEFSSKALSVPGFTKSIQVKGKGLYWKRPGGSEMVITNSKIDAHDLRQPVRMVFVAMLILSVTLTAWLLRKMQTANKTKKSQ